MTEHPDEDAPTHVPRQENYQELEKELHVVAKPAHRASMLHRDWDRSVPRLGTGPFVTGDQPARGDWRLRSPKPAIARRHPWEPPPRVRPLPRGRAKRRGLSLRCQPSERDRRARAVKVRHNLTCMQRSIRRLAQLARPEAIRVVQNGLRFGRTAQLSSDRWTQARHGGGVEVWGFDLLPPMRLTDGLVVDVGANVGRFTSDLLTLEPAARVLAIEPSPDVYHQIAARFRSDARVRVDNRAMTDSAGTVTFNLTEDSVFGSVLTPRDLEAEYQGGATVTAQAEVPAARLDDIVDEPVSLLKIDVQGNEPAVLRGASRVLNQTRAVLLEVTFVSHYHGDATFVELHPMMEDAGFVLREMGKVRRGGERALWADACYVPR
jgi:FkbM family methyltransferase